MRGISGLFAQSCAALCLLATALSAQDMTLTSRDGSIEIIGTFRSYDGEFYRVETDVGVLTVASGDVKCEGPGCPDLNAYFADIRLSAPAPVIDGLLRPLIMSFAAQNSYEITETSSTILLIQEGRSVGEFQLSATGLERGLQDLAAEQVDLVVGTRSLSPNELAVLEDSGVGDLSDPLRARAVALDALVPVIGPLNTLSSLPINTLQSIYAGEITNWKDITGRDAPIVLHVYGSAQNTILIDRDTITDEAIVHDSYSEMVEAISADPYAFGMVPLTQADELSQLTLTGPCGFVAKAQPRAIKTEDYPFVSPVFLYSPRFRQPAITRDFMRFVTSEAAQPVIAASQYVDQSVEELPLQINGLRLSNAIAALGNSTSVKALKETNEALQGARRLTLVFRFEDGSSRLDAHSKTNALILAEQIAGGRYDGKTLLFAGFSDGSGDAAQNQALSQRRAESVLERITGSEGFDESKLTVEAKGFGETMPLACDEDAWGRALNRRVEVWVSE